MPNTDAYALQRSDLNGFLFADVGVEASGMTLSVLSVLARLGMDPWQEAGRLAKLPRTAAVDGLARIIATMPASLWSLPDATAIAARLVALLPARGSPSIVPSAQPANATTILARLLAFLPARGGAPVRLATGSQPAGRWMVALALLAAVLAGLTFNFRGPRDTAPETAAAAARWSTSHPTSPTLPDNHTSVGE